MSIETREGITNVRICKTTGNACTETRWCGIWFGHCAKQIAAGLDKAAHDPQPAAEPTKPRLYLSGPMTGLPDNNYPAFNAEAARLRALGYDIVNPAELKPPASESDEWHHYLRRDLREMLTCDGLALMPGWHNSKGAHLEIQVAHRIEMSIWDAKDLT